jgi:hypothetical protein
MGLGEYPKFVVKAHGPAFNQGVIGDATIEFVGSGLVGTAYGFPGLSATLVGTGLYDIRFPTVANRGIRMYPHAMAGEPKGATGAFIGPQGSGTQGVVPGFNVHMSHLGGQSGSAYLNTTSQIINASGAVGPTGLRPAFPPTGSVVNLLIVGSPISRY